MNHSFFLVCFSVRSCASVQDTLLTRTPWPFQMGWPSTGRRCTMLASARSLTWCSLLPTSSCPLRWMTQKQASSALSVSSLEVNEGQSRRPLVRIGLVLVPKNDEKLTTCTSKKSGHEDTNSEQTSSHSCPQRDCVVTPACACSKEGITHKCYLSNQILAVVTPILGSSPRGDQRVDPDAGLKQTRTQITALFAKYKYKWAHEAEWNITGCLTNRTTHNMLFAAWLHHSLKTYTKQFMVKCCT